MERFGLSLPKIYRILKEVKTMKRSRVPDKKKFSSTTTEIKRCQGHILLRQIASFCEEEGDFTIKRLMERVGLKMREVSRRTVQWFLHSNGYRYLNSRKKGVLLNTDFKRRVKSGKAIRKDYNKKVWTEKNCLLLRWGEFYSQI